ncbi:MAG: hypothetical protein MUC67_07955, partial [Acidobacteria bacterium]|nr:hypothetical protein [Acidobacteriota bacterium]
MRLFRSLRFPALAALAALLLVALAAPAARAATPPPLVNYQGVLRDAADKPRSGSFDMVFRFFSAASAGDEILVDSRLAANALAVTVGNGLFSVQLGGGVVGDGTGPGTYSSLADVFRDYAAVWLQIEVGPAGGARETLNPRVRIVAAAYAMNASTAQSALDAANLGGRAPSAFLDTSSTFQTKAGGLKAQEASTNTAGIFANSGSGVSLATAVSGLLASGPVTGGEFYNGSSGSFALLSNGNDGVVGRGQWGGCETCGAGGVFTSGTLYTGTASLSVGDAGLVASGDFAAGIFRESDSGANAYLGYNATAVAGYAVNPGENPAYFEDSSSGLTWAAVGQAGFKIKGTGGVSFVQNHPFDPAAEIVYTAPEGDEAAVYTRGSARLVDGEARVALGETFRLVANPDVGLTAHVTPRGAWSDLYVASVTTQELVVRSRDGGAPDAAFDYAVWGLRIGFEERPAIRPKERNAPLPSRVPDEALFAARPDLRASTPLARFAAMREGALAGGQPLDLTRARALAAAIDAASPAEFAPAATRAGRVTVADPPPAAAGTNAAGPARGPVGAHQAADRSGRAAGSAADRDAGAAAAPLAASAFPAFPPGALPAPVAERVEAGDVLAADPLRPGALVRSAAAAEVTVAGIVAGEPGSVFDGEAPLAFAGTIVSVKADAAERPIAPGDLLVASPLPGHAMRAPGDAAP